MSIFVVEPTDERSRRRLFRTLGVDWLGTAFWPGLLVWTLIVSVLGGLFFAPAGGNWVRVVIGLGYWALTLVAVVVHSLGHIASGQAVGARMYANLITATVPVNLYHQDVPVTRRVHLARAAGGPVASLVLGAIALGAAQVASGGGYFGWLAAMSLAIGLMALMPLPTLDGGVFARELRARSAPPR